MKLLLVDDSKLTRSRMHSQLGSIPGITSIVCAGTQSQAQTSILHECPTLAILHLHLPVGLGTEIIAILKSLMPNLLIAVLTIHVNHSYRETCMTQGADWFFDKATEFDDLLAMLSQHAALSAGVSYILPGTYPGGDTPMADICCNHSRHAALVKYNFDSW